MGRLSVVLGCLAIALRASFASVTSLGGEGWTCDGSPVTVPHTWNEPDGSDGLGVPKGQRGHNSVSSRSYCRKAATYVRALPDPKPDRRYFIRFEGVSDKATVSVNGREVGSHVGAFAAFTLEITEVLKDSGNVLSVTADNRYDPSVPPNEGDFTVFGGIYRDVLLIEKPCKCIDPRQPILVRADPETGVVEITFTPYGESPRTERRVVENPERWSPESPRLYSFRVAFGEDEETVEAGFRKIEFRPDGFYLNGQRRQIHGVCRHQDRGGRGWALTAADEEADVREMKELGADGVRTSHYPNSSRFYSLCDRYGLLVWTEIPLVDEVPKGDATFRAHALAMAEEMVCQHYNHPSIVVWGIFNEVYQFRPPDGSIESVLAEIRDKVHGLDASRPVGGASNGRKIGVNAVPDVLGMNLYPGWYGTSVDMMDTFIAEACAENRRTSVAITEYGAGGSHLQHDDALARPRAASFWHPEEYQAYFHARAYRYMVENPLVWGTFAWQMFDSASDSRQEGDHAGINDKGLVTRDRKVRKDAWYLYHANWSKEPVFHLVGSRWRETDRDEINVLGFSNVGDAELYVNGVHFSSKRADPSKTLLWEEVPLRVGTNLLTATAGGMKRELTIVRKPALAPFPKWSESRAVTSGPHEHLLASYFAIDCWSPDRRYMLVLETDVNGRLPRAGERCTLGVVDLQDANRFIPVTTTACWNFQEAAMAFWMDNETILFNDVRDGRFSAVVMDWRTGKDVRVLPRPVAAVSEDRRWAVSLNFARLSLVRPDYGYAGPGQDPLTAVEWPEDDGLWKMDLTTGASRLMLSVAAARPQMPRPQRVAGKPGQPLAYFCHTAISKDGEKVFFLARSVDWFDAKTHEASTWETTAFTVGRDGSGLRRCFKDGWAGSHFNWAPDGSHKMLVTAIWNGEEKGHWTKNQWSTVEFEVERESEVRRIGAGILDLDWHCIYSPDGKFMSGETYWNKSFCRPWVLVRLQDGMTMPMGTFYVPERYRGTYWRCDLHARYRPDGRQIAFTSVHEGSRQVYVRDVEP